MKGSERQKCKDFSSADVRVSRPAASTVVTAVRGGTGWEKWLLFEESDCTCQMRCGWLAFAMPDMIEI